MTNRRDFLLQTSAAVAAGIAADFLPSAIGDEKTPPTSAVSPAHDLPIPDWVSGVTRMAFVAAGDVARAAKAGAQVVHTNSVWPYYPLRRDGGGLSKADDRALRELVAGCHDRGMKIVLGLPPFPSVALVKAHPDWRVRPADNAAAAKVEPREDNLGTRLGCNLGPWGDYLIEVCGELVTDYGLDGYSFDGNYHPPICYCPACKAAYRQDRRRELPAKVNLDDVAYREYLVWRGERLEDHYRRLQGRIKGAKGDAVLMSWTVNAGRYGHFLYSPRAMPTRLNRLFDLPMQEWWLDETNVGASLMPAFGAAYLRATVGERPCASEPYLMSRGNPYGTDSFPAHERLTRCLLAVSNGNVLAESLGWAGHEASAAADFGQVARRERFLTRTERLPWAALFVSEQTRQFYAYKDIAERFLPPVLGAFRAATEEHLPLSLINDWNIEADTLSKYAVVVLANAAALSDAQVAAIRGYVRAGGGLVVTGETSLCDELGRPRRDFALTDVLGVHYLGRPKAAIERPKLDENFAVALDENYWKQRTGVATLTWNEAAMSRHDLLNDAKLNELVPGKHVIFRGPLVQVSEPAAAELGMRMKPEGWDKPPLPALVTRMFGRGRVAYFAAGVDAALWTYAYPYQRRILARAIEWAAREPAPISIRAPLCVQATYFAQQTKAGRRVIVHLFNGVNSTANHGLPAMDVPLREETIPIHGIEIRFHQGAPKTFRLQPGDIEVRTHRDGEATVVELPPLEIHSMLVAE